MSVHFAQSMDCHHIQNSFFIYSQNKSCDIARQEMENFEENLMLTAISGMCKSLLVKVRRNLYLPGAM